MKTTLYTLLALASWTLVKAITESESISVLRGLTESCDIKLDDQGMLAIIKNEEDVNHDVKCFRKCFMEQMDMWNECKMDPEKFKEVIALAFENKDEESIAIANICNEKIVCDDECEAAHSLAMCVMDEFKARNWELPQIDKDE